MVIDAADTLHGTRLSPQDQSMIHLEIDGERYPIAAGETVIGSAVRQYGGARGRGCAAPACRGAGHAGRRRRDPRRRPARRRFGSTAFAWVPILPRCCTATRSASAAASCWWWIRRGPAAPSSSTPVPSPTSLPPPGSKGTGTRTGGRLVCLTDGREYSVGRGRSRWDATPDRTWWWPGARCRASTPRSAPSRTDTSWSTSA